VSTLRAPLRVAIGSATGAIHGHGSQVVSWQPMGQSEVLWMSTASAFDSATAIRGGIPICFPWFGSGRSGTLTPSHGFARLTPWALIDVVEQDGTVSVTHTLQDDQATRHLFPHRFMAVHTARFGEHLDVHLSVENLDHAPFTYEAALHTYLRVGDSRQIVVRGLDGVEYLDKGDGGQAKRQSGDVTISAETDRIYRSGTGVDVVDQVLGRTIRVRMSHTADTVVWNPWVERAAALADFDDDGWQSMVCIEGANVQENAISLQPGEIHSMGYQLSVVELA
jgi:glucose-6-phosphate 1-epimerase